MPVRADKSHLLRQLVQTLVGHSSSLLRTRSSFVLPPLTAGGPSPLGCGLLVSADEGTQAPWLWSLDSGAVVQKLQPHPHGAVCQVREWCTG